MKKVIEDVYFCSKSTNISLHIFTQLVLILTYIPISRINPAKNRFTKNLFSIFSSYEIFSPN
jgi:hypothetical protein